jgi:hypothetical protein
MFVISKSQLISAQTLAHKLTLENTLSLIPAAVDIPVISTVVKLSLSVVTWTLTRELCVEPDLARCPYSKLPKLFPLSIVVAGLKALSGLAMRTC